jgi:iron complex transport system ATP-binding protein
MPLIEIESVSFRYGRKSVIDDLSLTCEAGRATALLGPNGSGKSTLLKLLLGLLRPRQGVIRFQGRRLDEIPQRELARQIAYVPQVHREAFGYTVFDVALMGRMPHSSFFVRYGEQDRAIVRDALEKLEIAHLADQPYTQISGGERQLTLIARALAQGAQTFVMDEPSNSLDYGNQLRLLERIGRLASEGYTFLFSTHHPEQALAIADRVVMMRKGRIVRDGEPGENITPETLADLYGFSPSLFESAHFRSGAVGGERSWSALGTKASV